MASLSRPQRDLLPFSMPYPAAASLSKATSGSRNVLRRLHSKGGWQSWANDGVLAVNELYGFNGFSQCSPSPSKTAALSQFCRHFEEVGKPPTDLTPARAFVELCQNSLPYITDGRGPAPYEEGKVSLPAVGNHPVVPQDCLSPEHSALLTGRAAPMLRPILSVDDARISFSTTSWRSC